MLNIKDLHASVEGKQILRGLNLEVKSGEVHAIMGPNGSGKSTLAQVLAGRDSYTVEGGSVDWDGKDLLALPAEERAREGLFLAFQYPVEIPGVSNAYFLKAAVNAVRRHRKLPELDAMDFLKRVKAEMKAVGMREEFLYRSVNEGFSGGEKKRNEVLQMALLEPKLAVLDETDSGLDIDALKIVAEGVNRLRSPERSMIVITHYQRLLDYIVPDKVHVLSQGRIVRSGGRELALELDGTAGARRTARAQEMLDLVGLGDRADASVHELYRLRTSQDTADVRTRAGAAWSSRSSRRNASQPDRRRKGSAARRGPSSFFRSIRPRGAGVGSRRASHPRAPAEARSRRPSARGGRRLPWPAGPCRTGCRSSPRPRRRLRGRTGP